MLDNTARQRFTEVERIEQIVEMLDHANGDGLTVSDIRKQLGLSRKRVHDILERMTHQGDCIKCYVEGSAYRYGLFLYFHLYHFEKIASEKAEVGRIYRLRQRTIFELIEGEK